MQLGKYKIIATFKYGRVWSDFIVGLMLFLAVTMTFGVEWLSFVTWNENLRLAILALCVDLFVMGLFIFEFVKVFRNRRYAKRCVKDSIEKTTVAKYAENDNGLGLNYKGIKISVSFHEKGRKIRKYSVYDRVFNRYSDKEVTILYSPIYEEILLCKILVKEE